MPHGDVTKVMETLCCCKEPWPSKSYAWACAITAAATAPSASKEHRPDHSRMRKGGPRHDELFASRPLRITQVGIGDPRVRDAGVAAARASTKGCAKQVLEHLARTSDVLQQLPARVPRVQLVVDLHRLHRRRVGVGGHHRQGEVSVARRRGANHRRLDERGHLQHHLQASSIKRGREAEHWRN